MFGGPLRKTRPSIIYSRSASNIAIAPAISIPAATSSPKTPAAKFDLKFDLAAASIAKAGCVDVAMKDDKAALIRLERIRIWERNKPDHDTSNRLPIDVKFHIDRSFRRFGRCTFARCIELNTSCVWIQSRGCLRACSHAVVSPLQPPAECFAHAPSNARRCRPLPPWSRQERSGHHTKAQGGHEARSDGA